MKKADLLRLPKLKITKEIKEVAKSDKGMLKGTSQYKYRIYKYKNYYRAKVFKEILKVEIYTRDRDDILREDPSYLIFISKNDKKFITWDAIEEKWRTAKIDRIDSRWNYYEEKRYYSRGTEKTIIEYLDNGKKRGYESIYQFQADIREEKLKKQHRSITDAIDSKMELVPDLPKGFKKWVENRAMKHSRYIYYVYSRKVEEGYCTHCRNIVKLKEKPRYNQDGICPQCKSAIVYKTEKRAGQVIDNGYASIFQKTREGYVFRYFEVTKRYYDYKHPDIEITEGIRVFYNNNFELAAGYEYTEFRNTGIIRWCNRDERNYYSYYSNTIVYQNSSTLYTRNLKRLFKDTKYQYSAIEIFAKNTHQFMPIKYLNTYKRDKFLEYLVKAKLYNIADDYIKGYWSSGLNRNGKRIHDVLKVKKEQVKKLSQINPTIDQLITLQEANEKNVTLSEEQFILIASFHCDALLN